MAVPASRAAAGNPSWSHSEKLRKKPLHHSPWIRARSVSFTHCQLSAWIGVSSPVEPMQGCSANTVLPGSFNSSSAASIEELRWCRRCCWRAMARQQVRKATCRQDQHTGRCRIQRMRARRARVPAAYSGASWPVHSRTDSLLGGDAARARAIASVSPDQSRAAGGGCGCTSFHVSTMSAVRSCLVHGTPGFTVVKSPCIDRPVLLSIAS
eukprot:3775891-Prymnesium_polylepis.1